VFPQAVGSNVYQQYHRAVAEQIGVQFEEYSATLDRWFEVHAFPSAEGLSVYFRDIHERKKSELALRQSERDYRHLLNEASDAILIADADWNWITVNPQACALLGYTETELLSMRVVDVVAPEDLAAQPLKLDALRNHQRVRSERLLLCKDGRRVPTEISSRILPDGRFQASVRDTTERKQAEAALRRGREWLELVHGAGGIGAWEWDLRADRAIWSESYYALLGLAPHSEASYARWLECMHPDDLGLIEANFAAVAAGGRFICEYRMVRPDGQVRWHYCVGTSYLDAEGQPHSVVGISVDVTERKLAESALRESEQRYRSLVDNATDLIYSHGLDGRFLSINQAGEEITGYTQAELLQLTLLDLVAPEYWDLLRQRAAERTVHGNLGRTTCELELVTRDGRRVPVEVSSAPLIRDGCTIALQGIARDITERRAAEEALHASEARFRVICEASPIGVFLSDAEGSGVYANPTMLRYLGLDEQTALNAGWRSALPPDDALQIAAAWEQAVANQADFERTHQLVRPDGSEIHVVVRAAPIRQKGMVIGFVGSVVDITERITLEEQLRQSQKMDAVGRLAGGVAHDFNNMLAVINGYSELCLGEVEPGSPWREPLQEIHRAGERAATLTRQLLAFSRKQMLRPVPLDLNQVVADTHTMLSRLIGEDILLGTRLAPDLGWIHADPGQIEQVILNLVVNARDAMPRGGRLLLSTRNATLDVAALRAHAGQAPGPYVLLEVSDTGCGMPPEVQARIFEPFFTTKGLGEGTGLGLATVYGIVSQSGGHLEVESAPGAGTTFRIYLPAVVEAPEPAPAPPAPEAPPGSETILLVEDEVMVRTLLRTVLAGCGYQVLEAGTSEELDRVRAQYRGPLDLLITDVVMPTRSGPEVSALLRLQYPELKVLYISGYTDDAVFRHGMSTAETAFLQKPFSPVTLAQKVRELLN
jgi:PAS domain S-box-containing protein